MNILEKSYMEIMIPSINSCLYALTRTLWGTSERMPSGVVLHIWYQNTQAKYFILKQVRAIIVSVMIICLKLKP